MRAKNFSILLMAGPCIAIAASQSRVDLDQASGLRVSREAATSADDLARDWGQFEFTLPKEHFPVPAPNCNGRIKLRLVAVPPGAVGRPDILARRWALLGALREIQSGRMLEIQLSVDLSHYVTHGPDGTTVLQYCSAFSDGEFALQGQ